MDMMAMVSTMLAAQTGALQSKMAATLMKQNLDAEKFAVQTLLGGASQGAPPSLANVAAGIGGNLNVSA